MVSQTRRKYDGDMLVGDFEYWLTYCLSVRKRQITGDPYKSQTTLYQRAIAVVDIQSSCGSK